MGSFKAGVRVRNQDRSSLWAEEHSDAEAFFRLEKRGQP